jgi:Bifunctional DNA primase/polymerase, N-terminal
MKTNSNSSNARQSIQWIPDLLGHAVLLGWPLGTKGHPKRWSHLTVANMTPAYLKKLERGNIGVALGAKSGNLIALDVDVDEMIEPFIVANPFLNDTLQTHGARGRVFWFRMVGEYPTRTVKLKTHSGDDCGEFRSNGSQSIIHGIHPDTGKPYQVLNLVKPVVVDFASIVWPTEISNPPSFETHLPANDTERQSDGETDVTDDTEAIVGESLASKALTPLSEPVCKTIDEAVQLALPDKAHQNNDRLFTLARAVKTLEIQFGKFTPAQLRDVFSRWFKRAIEFLRPEHTRDDYMTQFMNAYASAKVPLGEGVISQAWKLAQENPLPPEALENFEDGEKRLLVGLCRELQIIAGQEPFYLSARTVQQLLKQDGHATAARWLRSFCVLQILKETEKGSGVKASRYRYTRPI